MIHKVIIVIFEEPKSAGLGILVFIVFLFFLINGRSINESQDGISTPAVVPEVVVPMFDCSTDALRNEGFLKNEIQLATAGKLHKYSFHSDLNGCTWIKSGVVEEVNALRYDLWIQPEPGKFLGCGDRYSSYEGPKINNECRDFLNAHAGKQIGLVVYSGGLVTIKTSASDGSLGQTTMQPIASSGPTIKEDKPIQSASAIVNSPSDNAPPPAPSPTLDVSAVSLPSIVGEANTANRSGIDEVLAFAATGSNADIEAKARESGRAYDFAGTSLQRDRKSARRLNDDALAAFNTRKDVKEAYGLQQQAFNADPLDLEVAGNLAIFALRAGHNADARDLALYALSLPRQGGKTGRTADWATLAAAYANLGDQQKARASLFVTLAIAPDVKKRCYSAVYSTKNTYGPALKEATEAMFQRIQERGLSADQECSLPISWSW